MMIHWLWAIFFLVIGIMAGMFLAAMLEAGDDREDKDRWHG